MSAPRKHLAGLLAGFLLFLAPVALVCEISAQGAAPCSGMPCGPVERKIGCTPLSTLKTAPLLADARIAHFARADGAGFDPRPAEQPSMAWRPPREAARLARACSPPPPDPGIGQRFTLVARAVLIRV